LSTESKNSDTYKANKANQDKFEQEGLRTLFLAERILTEEEYE